MKTVWTTVVILISLAAQAAETKWWRVDSAEDLLKGRGAGVAVTNLGSLTPVDGWTSAVSFDEPVVLAGDRLPDGDVVVATGHPARLYRVGRRGAELLAELPGEQATAVLAQADGTVWIATMAPGRLLRFRDGNLEEAGQLGEGAFWDLVEFDGQVVAAAGPPAALFRVGPEGLIRWVEVSDAFARCAVTDGDRLVVGTSGEGLILQVDRRGRTALLVDSPFTEISALVPAGDGSLWATALVGEPVPTTKASSTNGNGKTEAETSSLNLDLPKVNGKTATSEVLRITPEGGILSLHRFTKQVASALARDGDGVLVGTGYEGEVWRFVASGGARLANLDAVQVVAFIDDGKALLTQGPAAFFERTSADEKGRFRSKAEEWSLPVRFGRFTVIGAGDPGRIRFRSGAASKGDPTWLAWTAWQPANSGVVDVAFGRVLQWELEIPRGSSVDAVEVAWREVNMPPLIREISVEDPGVVYLGAPPPSGPVIQQDHPTFSGLFTTLGADPNPTPASATGKKYYQVGYRTVGWKVVDPNNDPLLFDVALETPDGRQLPVRKRLEATAIAVDTTAVPDGRYRFLITASDVSANPADPQRVSGSSPWFDVDSTSPLVKAEKTGGGWRVTVIDSSALSLAEVSLDGERWVALAPKDGILDGGTEVFEVSAGTDRNSVAVVRVFDAHHNRAVLELQP